jgi:hypothetical protein
VVACEEKDAVMVMGMGRRVVKVGLVLMRRDLPEAGE